MTHSSASAVLGHKGLVNAGQTHADGELRAEAAAALVADGLEGLLATRRGPSDAASTPRPKARALTLEPVAPGLLRVGDIASCRIDAPSDAAAATMLQATLQGPGGAAWRATLRLDQALPEAAAASAPDPAGPALPPLRVLRPMRKSHCDQAGHVNVQVFMDLADEASTVLGLEAIGKDAALRITQARISFKRELFEGDVVAVHSGIRLVDGQQLEVVHGIVDQASGALACVLETRLRSDAPIAIATAERVGDWPALPLARPPAAPRASAEPPADAVTTSLSVVDAWDADRSGCLSARAMVNLCSTGARCYLASIGLDGARFLREQITVAAVDYLIDIRERPPMGCGLAFRSAFLSGSAKSIRFSHHLVDGDNGTVYAVVEIVGVMLDLKTHRSMEIPGDVRQRLRLAID